jgi:hypothetical protein
MICDLLCDLHIATGCQDHAALKRGVQFVV